MILRRNIPQVKGLQAALDALSQNIQTASLAAYQNAHDEIVLEIYNREQADLAIAATVTTLDAAAAKKAANLSDLANASTARSNLSVYSTAEVDTLINQAKAVLGTNFVVADVTERDALDTNTGDKVTVLNGGNWTMYQKTNSGWEVIATKQEFLSAQSAAAIKTAYESNADTNAFTDAEKAMLAQLSGTRNVDLTTIVTTNDLAATVSGSGSATTAASTASVVAYVTEAVRVGGAKFMSEAKTVASNKIVLSFAPKDGVVLNFSTARYIDGDGVTWDIQLTADLTDSTGKTYTVNGDSVGQFDGESLAVQYSYVEPA